MNVSEMYRELKMTKDEFFQKVQELGFDIGERAIKVDDAVAVKIIQAVKQQRKQTHKKSIFDTGDAVPAEAVPAAEGQERVLAIPDSITVKEFAERVGKRVPDMIAILMQNGIMATINESLEYETAAIVAEEMGFTPKHSEEQQQEDTDTLRAKMVEDTLANEEQGMLKDRAPVIVIMGHVDHGKTSLLDAIRDTHVVAGEAGGITQHIGAYQVEKNGRHITFIDTPGHQAFTMMRSRGARVADIAILVVAADDGIKPQTEEAIHIIEKAGLPFIVAINKIDKPGADVERVKKELSQLNLIPEDYGGKTICVAISAKQLQNIDGLLDTVLLVADMEREHIQANPTGATVGTIIESHMDSHMGPVATVLVQNGTLHIGDIVQIGAVAGRVRALRDWRGQEMPVAGPSAPAQVLGLKGAPVVGDIMRVTTDKKVLKESKKDYSSFAMGQKKKDADSDKKKLYIILRADKLGSLEALLHSLAGVEHPEVSVDVVNKGLGNITENDIALAQSTGAVVLGFQTGIAAGAEKYARDEQVEYHTYTIIYELIDAVKDSLEKMLSKKVTFTKVGALNVLAVFRQEQTYRIVGGRVESGVVRVHSPIKILRGGTMVGEGIISQLQEDKKNTSEVKNGRECGLRVDTETPIQPHDLIECYQEESHARTLAE